MDIVLKKKLENDIEHSKLAAILSEILSVGTPLVKRQIAQSLTIFKRSEVMLCCVAYCTYNFDS